MQEQQAERHSNVMEILVNEEIETQLQKLPPKLSAYINSVEVATYALNRLPTLYASSKEGFKKQRLRGETEFQKDITTAVRQGLFAVQRDPLRLSTPLISEKDINSQEAQDALETLQGMLDSEQLSWEEVANFAQKNLVRKSRRNKGFWQK